MVSAVLEKRNMDIESLYLNPSAYLVTTHNRDIIEAMREQHSERIQIDHGNKMKFAWSRQDACEDTEIELLR